MKVTSRKEIVVILALLLAVFIFPLNVKARSGCCSHHGGVCGCGCCDGTDLSSTCLPYYPECSNQNTAPQQSSSFIPVISSSESSSVSQISTDSSSSSFSSYSSLSSSSSSLISSQSGQVEGVATSIQSSADNSSSDTLLCLCCIIGIAILIAFAQNNKRKRKK